MPDINLIPENPTNPRVDRPANLSEFTRDKALIIKPKPEEVPKIETKEQMTQYLKDLGVEFFKKRDFMVPQLEINDLGPILGTKDQAKIEEAGKCLDDIISYLNDQPITEPKNKGFKDHEERRKWYDEMEKLPFFKEVFEDNNQFRMNKVTGKVAGSMQMISKIAKDNNNLEFAEKLRNLSYEITSRIRGLIVKVKENGEIEEILGTPYYMMTEPEGKLEVVHFIEDKILEFFNLLVQKKDDEKLPLAA